jgi:hypothetical protein
MYLLPMYRDRRRQGVCLVRYLLRNQREGRCPKIGNELMRNIMGQGELHYL